MYPMHEKLDKVKGRSSAAGDFLEWLRDDKGYVIAQFNYREQLHAVLTSVDQLLAEWLGIDLAALEAEKRQMLEQMRKLNEQQATPVVAEGETAR